MELDRADKIIFRELLKDARATVSSLSAKVALSMPAVSDRLKRMKNEGLIEKFTIVPGATLRDKYPVAVNVLMKLKNTSEMTDFQHFLDDNEHVGWYSCTIGRYDFITYIRAMNMDQLQEIMQEITHHPSVADTETLLLTQDKYKGLGNLLIN